MGRTTNLQHSGHVPPWGSSPQRRHARRRPWNVGVAQCCFRSGDAALTVGATCWKFSFCSLVEVTGEHDRAELRAQIADEQNQRNEDGPPLGTLIVDVDVGDCEVGAQRVGPCETCRSPPCPQLPTRKPERVRDLDRRACKVARKSILVEENGAMVLGGEVKVLRKETVGDKASTSLNTNNVPCPLR